MSYRIELFDTQGLRVAIHDEVPLMQVIRGDVDGRHLIRGILPGTPTDLGHGYRVAVWLDEELYMEAYVTRVDPQWSDTKKLILERFVYFHEVVAFEAETDDAQWNQRTRARHRNSTASDVARRSINRTLGSVHYGVAHDAYPDGAEREYQKLLTRKTSANELEIGGIDEGQWVSGVRIDSSSTYAKDGDTIAGLLVDGLEWPDLRLMMIDAEESSLNSPAIARHPEVAAWTTAQYAASGYKLKADAATAALQQLIDTKGIDLIELNPHRGASGTFDDRVDTYGRYLGLVYGSGECFNAALVEQVHADVYLYDEGRFLVPELELKDFYSYRGVQVDTIAEVVQVVVDAETDGGLFPWLSALGYIAGGYGWSVDRLGCVTFRALNTVDRVVFFDPVHHALEWTTDSESIRNVIHFIGNLNTSGLAKTYTNSESIDAFGYLSTEFYFPVITQEVDADALCAGLLEDVAYPEILGTLTFHHGDATVRVGDLLELRNGPIRRLTPAIQGEWGDRFKGQHVGRVRTVTHNIEGSHVSTSVTLGSPFRSQSIPIDAMGKVFAKEEALYALHLDNTQTGIDETAHLD